MKKSLFYLIFAISILSMSMAPAQTGSPVSGKVNCQFNLGWPGPQTETPDWAGIVTINGVQYGMAFFNIGTGKSFTSEVRGTADFYEEIWRIYATLDYHFSDGVLDQFVPGQVLLSGNDVGVVSLTNSAYRMNGHVFTASGSFAGLEGSTVHMSGTISWDAVGNPVNAIGPFQINK